MTGPKLCNYSFAHAEWGYTWLLQKIHVKSVELSKSPIFIYFQRQPVVNLHVVPLHPSLSTNSHQWWGLGSGIRETHSVFLPHQSISLKTSCPAKSIIHRKENIILLMKEFILLILRFFNAALAMDSNLFSFCGSNWKGWFENWEGCQFSEKIEKIAFVGWPRL